MEKEFRKELKKKYPPERLKETAEDLKKQIDEILKEFQSLKEKPDISLEELTRKLSELEDKFEPIRTLYDLGLLKSAKPDLKAIYDEIRQKTVEATRLQGELINKFFEKR